MKIYDITNMLDEKTPVYKGDPVFRKEMVKDIKKEGFLLFMISMSTHAGTHMDAPSHTEPDGISVKDIPVEKLAGRCMVCDNLNDVEHACKSGIKKILIKGDFGGEYDKIDTSKIELIGIEALSIGGIETHKRFLKNNIVLLESLNLKGIPAGAYMLIALPLKTDTDGAPARAVLIDTEGEVI